MEKMKSIFISLSEEDYEKLKLVADHISTTPDTVAQRMLKALLDHGSWSLEQVKQTLESTHARPTT